MQTRIWVCVCIYVCMYVYFHLCMNVLYIYVSILHACMNISIYLSLTVASSPACWVIFPLGQTAAPPGFWCPAHSSGWFEPAAAWTSARWTRWPQTRWGSVCGSTRRRPLPPSPSPWSGSARWKTRAWGGCGRQSLTEPSQWLRSGLPPVAGCQRTRSSDQLSQSCLCKAEQRKGLAGSKELALDLCVHSMNVSKVSV